MTIHFPSAPLLPKIETKMFLTAPLRSASRKPSKSNSLSPGLLFVAVFTSKLPFPHYPIQDRYVTPSQLELGRRPGTQHREGLPAHRSRLSGRARQPWPAPRHAPGLRRSGPWFVLPIFPRRQPGAAARPSGISQAWFPGGDPPGSRQRRPRQRRPRR